jgi:NAD(P)-dependent dehydrogenase (short-subunit alcohol dehydrogenase family)
MLPHGAQGSWEGSAVYLAKELRESRIRVNAADPGYTATDFSDYRDTRRVEQSARSAAYLATLPEDGPTRGLLRHDGPLPW